MPRRLGLSLKLALAFLGVSALTLAIVLFILDRSTTQSFRSYLRYDQEMQDMMQGSDPVPGMSAMHGAAPMMGTGEQDFVDRLRLSLILGGIGGAAIAALVGLAIAGRITAPLREIEAAAKAVAQGDTSRRASVDSDDELGDLAGSFNQMAAVLARQEETRQQFVADVAHELRTPLAVLQGEIEALQDGVTQPTEERLASLHEETEILHRLVEDLRTLSLAEAGELNLVPARERAALVLGRAAAAMVETAARAGVTLVTDLPASLPEINLDSDRIVQVLMNLLSNAIRHTPAGGEVRVAAQVSGESLRVSVSDSGSGIPEEALPHVFDRFYRVDPSRSRDSGGSGLGLAIARQLVRMHGGDISARNNDGAGASFGFTLPLSPSSRQRRERQSAGAPEPGGTTVLPTG